MVFVKREPIRKVHITRILGTNKAGDVLPDIWLDVERFEQYARETQSWPASQYQRIVSKFRWHDDPDSQDYLPEDDEGTARDTEVLKVCSPDEDLDDPEEWVPVRIIKRVQLQGGDDQGSQTNQKFLTDSLTSERKVETRRVLHYDTSIDGKAEAAFDADPARRAYVASSDAYQKDDATKDEDQYVETEIVTEILKRSSAHGFSSGTDQAVYALFKNQYLLDETEPAKLEEVGSNDKNPPYRLDPFQNIVNVQFSFRVYVVITGARTDYAVPNPEKPGVKVIETKQGPGPQSPFMTGTLIECSASAGEQFASLDSTLVGGPGGEGGGEGSTLITIMVYPKTEKVRDNWWGYARAYQGIGLKPEETRTEAAGPFLWIAEFRAYGPCKVDFTIRNKPHLIGPVPPDVRDTIVEAYPTSGRHTGAGGNLEAVSVTGFLITRYRTDKKGTETLYVTPPAWAADEGITSTFPKMGGLRFGKDPPLIASDIPDTP